MRAPRLCALVGITYRQLDYWARIGLLIPSVSEAKGSGSWRFYSDVDVRIAAVMKGLLDAGHSLPSIRRLNLVPLLRSLTDEDWRGWLLLTRDAATVTSEPDVIVRHLAREASVCQLLDLASTEVFAANREVSAHA